MEIYCYLCQGSFAINYKDIFRLGEDYYAVICPMCGAENEVWDVEDWFEPEEVEWVHKHNTERFGEYEDLDDDELLDLLDDGGWGNE